LTFEAQNFRLQYVAGQLNSLYLLFVRLLGHGGGGGGTFVMKDRQKSVYSRTLE
jgi:hypothetical protein